MASPQKTKRGFKSSINHRLTPPNTQSFEPDKFKLKRGVKSENKTSENHRVTTSQLATTLAGIWSYIGQQAVLKSDENLNFEVCQKGNVVQCKNQSSAYKDLKAMKKRMLYSYYKMASGDILWDKGKYMKCHYIRAIYEPKYLGIARSVHNAKRNYCTVETTEDPLCGIDEMQEAVTQKEEEAMVVLKNEASDKKSENKIELSTPNSCVNTEKELLESSSSTVSEFTVNKFTDKGYGGRSDSLQDDFTRRQLFVQDRIKGVIYVHRHAVAGALAGTMVSLCLHPVDTVKTIIQSRGTGGYSFYRVLRQTLTERGLLGLYRGIASNIALSAPISAIYTFTYESVKGNLLPIFPKEYQSVTHCIAGGCSSVATSFVFTPSERIKQQMQVGTQYQNCWNALVGCIEKGGVATLYAGWRAVLCRNIPHSIIKFYTYERLKRFLLEDTPDSTLSSWQTLACGGMAGATAALFTTPFDVVKTRIQTQAPGTATKYNGVHQALNKIMKNEGVPGLYRGLTPRLGMYISQGSIFFASYEFLKTLFALDVERQSSKPESKRNYSPSLHNS
ncbi:putative mitochondrial adenine nucleotide transporter BTL3 isoform X1 [Carex littledalei]|uniref:Putative mitochondrial adenine nucleotide transporter BTL3 isoform X1 n=1 Tax=Carex littledalei TaxID=544730 RepID=A0A833RQW1_9POAL|nr:putative mitochondrial adenine nucleotide transporter BTL3 isoform X1 [Carex littledalei]